MRSIILPVLVLACVGCGGSGGGSNGGAPTGNGHALNMDPHVQHNLATLNNYRSMHGAAPLMLDDQLTAFAQTAAEMGLSSGVPHGYFGSVGQNIWSYGFCSSASENQTGPGWSLMGDEDATIDAVLAQMMAEGPGGGHYENIINKDSTRVGVGLVTDGQQHFYLSNDFSQSCK